VVEEVTPQPMQQTSTLGRGLAGSGSIISGSIVGINPVLDTLFPDSPCAQFPCEARVKIEKITRRDTEFGNMLEVGKELTVKFGFTLGPTSKALFPELSQHYPGLVVGDKFEAALKTKFRAMNNITHTVFHYQKVE